VPFPHHFRVVVNKGSDECGRTVNRYDTSALKTYRVILGAYPRQGGGLCYASDHAAVLAQFDI
jgi:hypothetical protein